MSALIDFANKLLARVDIVEVVGEYVPLKRAGQNYRGLCPFHREKTPSFNVSPTKQIFHCFGCGVGGDAIRFIMRIEHLEWVDALKLLAQKHGIPLPEFERRTADKAIQDAKTKLYEVNKLACEFYAANLQKALKDPKHPATQYLAKRKINAELATRFSLGLAPTGWTDFTEAAKRAGFEPETVVGAGLAIRHSESGRVYDRFRNRIIFPICDSLGRPVAFGARVYAPDAAPDEPKYINSPETAIYRKGQVLYGLHLAKDSIVREGYALLMEGYLDVIRAHQFGFTHAVATCGTALTEEQGGTLKKLARRVLFAYDGDEAGQKAMLRGCEVLLEYELGIQVVVLPDPHDPDSYLVEYGTEPFRQLIAKSRDFFDFFLDRAIERFGSGTVAAKVECVQFLIPILQRVRNAVAQREYVRMAARRLDVDEAALLRQLRSKQKSSPQQLAKTLTHATSSEPRSECTLLKLVVEYENMRAWAFEHVVPDWLASSRVRKWFERCRTLHAEGRLLGWESLLRECSDDETDEDARFLREVAFMEGEPVDQLTSETLSSFLARLKRSFFERMVADYCSTLRHLYPEDPEGETWRKMVEELSEHHPALREALLLAQRTSVLRMLPNFGH
ncbi:MAG: DNA primase [Candidatus Hydrogenedentota bacterium]|jgi:DNA primase|uniref:DNA primase n=1 Tax=Sumerlaea chitinivorans TaxID=2250252 RepID=A0A2Z4Y5B6_SUMC1|nr:DNA primase [Candidatus Sumerlaea chitinivorans]RMH29540.1 MAG: DNA primase [Candidatus Hydrogenedentota bacterium]GIX45097.1 MAG: DNA primase [Candidatus Sumerlaea sp.]